MTMEELLAIAKSDNRVYLERIIEFIDSNVVIPKGANRHPYADVLHEWIEGAELDYYGIFTDDWFNLDTSHSIHNARGYRIKSQEPVYEWQWLVKEFTDTPYYVLGGGSYFTKEEVGLWHSVKRLDETKRERK